MSPATQVEEVIAEEVVLYMALELSARSWKVGFEARGKRFRGTVEGGDVRGLLELVGRARERFSLSAEVRVLSCYEAGRDGFWLHRALCSAGIENVVVDSSSIEVSRRRRRVKTDRVDREKLLEQLIRWSRGERGALHVVRVPSVDEEDARRLHRELKRLEKEVTAHGNRLRALLTLHGCAVELGRGFLERLEAARQWDGEALPAGIRAELEREWERRELARAQVRALHAQRRARLKAPRTRAEHQVVQMMELGGLGPNSAWLFVMEFFGWRRFRNRREVGALAGLTGTAHASGEQVREQGISKAGNARVRSMAVEIAWLWLRYQPDSALTRWFNERFAGGGKRMRRVGIVALARRLLVALWRYLEHGAMPQGARLIASQL